MSVRDEVISQCSGVHSYYVQLCQVQSQKLHGLQALPAMILEDLTKTSMPTVAPNIANSEYHRAEYHWEWILVSQDS